MEWVDKYGNLFSLIGLIITFFTLIGVVWNKRLLIRLNRKNFKLNRLPENLADLMKISENISDYIADFENNKKNVKYELSKIQPILKSLSKSLENNETDNMLKLKDSLKDIDNWTFESSEKKWFNIFSKQNQLMTEIMITEIYIKLNRLITDIENIGKDNNKSLF
ncbi:MAG: hypothetical protein JJU28_03200 [Cyclobacteriaceae bacterium]|nr:hypothetical protein [Cyclobacteriaceae bacterium]